MHCNKSVVGKMTLQSLWLKPIEKRVPLCHLSRTSRPIYNLRASAFTWAGSVRVHQRWLHSTYYDSEVFGPVVKPLSRKVISSSAFVVILFSDATSI